MELKYRIEMLSEWHIGSGLGAGAETDAEILKNEHGLPYVPGKTIKGLLKDAFRDIVEVNSTLISQEDIELVFGDFDSDKKKSIAGSSYFSNAELDASESGEIVNNGLQNYLFKNIASTRIDKNGVAEDKSLRTMEICMPLTLHGSITVHDSYLDKIETGMQWIRHLGVNRNHGLGRCKFIIEK